MLRDTSALPTDSDCYHLLDDKTLLVDDMTTELRYVLISDKWTWESSRPSPTMPGGTGTACQTFAEIQAVPSYYDFITPVYYMIAIVSAIAIFYSAYRLILYPFFRKKV